MRTESAWVLQLPRGLSLDEIPDELDVGTEFSAKSGKKYVFCEQAPQDIALLDGGNVSKLGRLFALVEK